MPLAAPTCRFHPDVASAAACNACLAPICGSCLVSFRGEVVCPGCATELRRRHQFRSSMTIVLAIVGSLGLAAVVGAYLVLHRASFEYGRLGPAVERARARLAETPCDRSAAVQLADTLAEAGDARGTLAFAQSFFGQCGEEPRIRWATYTAHKQLGEWDAAIDDATRLIDSEPQDKDYRWWRAVVWERKGQFEKAATDYEKAIELEPRLTNIPINLATLYEKMKRPCDAARTLRTYIEKHPETATTLSPRAASLETSCRGNVPAPAALHDAPVPL